MSDPEDKDHEEVPEGMVRKTRKVRKKRRGSHSTEEGRAQADTLFSKGKNLLVGMEEENDDFGHVDVAEQIRRLKKGKEDDRPLDEVWGTKKRSSSWLWIVLVGIIVLVMATIVGVTRWLSQDAGPRLGSSSLNGGIESVGSVEDIDLGEGPLGWFHEDSIQVLADVRKVIAKINEAEDRESLGELLRASSKRREGDLNPALWGSECLTNATSHFRWQPRVVRMGSRVGEGERGFLQITGTRIDGAPYEAYFVKEDGRVKLDWDATIGWSEMSFSELLEQKPRREVFLRCRVTKKASFDQDFGDVNYSGYVISGEDGEDFTLAYLPLDSETNKTMDRGLRLLLNYGSFVTDQPPHQNQKATLRVRYNAEIGKDGVFEIVEFLHDGWVSP